MNNEVLDYEQFFKIITNTYTN